VEFSVKKALFLHSYPERQEDYRVVLTACVPTVMRHNLELGQMAI